MTICKFASTRAAARHPQGGAIAIFATLLVVLLVVGLAAAAYLFGPWTKPTAAKEVKKTETKGISPRVLHTPSRPQGHSPRQ